MEFSGERTGWKHGARACKHQAGVKFQDFMASNSPDLENLHFPKKLKSTERVKCKFLGMGGKDPVFLLAGNWEYWELILFICNLQKEQIKKI